LLDLGVKEKLIS
jgi:hypothetical protein